MLCKDLVSDINNKYEGESKVLQYFGNIKNNYTPKEVFAYIRKMTNHTGLGDAKLAWYFLSTTHLICLYD